MEAFEKVASLLKISRKLANKFRTRILSDLHKMGGGKLAKSENTNP